MDTFKCKKGLLMEDSHEVAFTEGNTYQLVNPEVWPPDKSIKYCFIDDLGKEHFLDKEWLNRHFETTNEKPLQTSQ